MMLFTERKLKRMQIWRCECKNCFFVIFLLFVDDLLSFLSVITISDKSFEKISIVVVCVSSSSLSVSISSSIVVTKTLFTRLFTTALNQLNFSSSCRLITWSISCSLRTNSESKCIFTCNKLKFILWLMLDNSS